MERVAIPGDSASAIRNDNVGLPITLDQVTITVPVLSTPSLELLTSQPPLGVCMPPTSPIQPMPPTSPVQPMPPAPSTPAVLPATTLQPMNEKPSSCDKPQPTSFYGALLRRVQVTIATMEELLDVVEDNGHSVSVANLLLLAEQDVLNSPADIGDRLTDHAANILMKLHSITSRFEVYIAACCQCASRTEAATSDPAEPAADVDNVVEKCGHVEEEMRRYAAKRRDAELIVGLARQVDILRICAGKLDDQAMAANNRLLTETRRLLELQKRFKSKYKLAHRDFIESIPDLVVNYAKVADQPRPVRTNSQRRPIITAASRKQRARDAALMKDTSCAPAPLFIEGSVKCSDFKSSSVEKFPEQQDGSFLLAVEDSSNKTMYENVRNILDELTPEKFRTSVKKIRSLPINNSTRLEGVIDLIYQKAIDEPGCSRWYAEMCCEMQSLSVPNESGATDSFRKILLNKCQNEFFREKAAELDSKKRLAEIETCDDSEKKKELEQEFEKMEHEMRRKSVGNCRFIGELFKLQMLTAKIMIRCVHQLLSNQEEESLECYCILLTTVGKYLETKLGQPELDPYFVRMQGIIDDKNNKVSSRIRFMLQDVIDLRRNKWIPKREADNAKTIGQMNREFEKEEQDAKIANMVSCSIKFDDYGGRNLNFKKHSKNEKEEWQTLQSNKNNYSKPSHMKFDANKIENMIPRTQVDVFIGPPTMGMWRSGVSSANKPVTQGSIHLMSSLSARNSVSRLTQSNLTEKLRPFTVPRDAASGNMSRSGSTKNMYPVSCESSVERATSSRNASQSGSQSSGPPQVEREILERYCKTILEELALNNNLEDSISAFEERINPRQINDAMECFINIVLEKVKLTNDCGRLFAACLKNKLITLPNILHMFSSIMEFAEDMLIDYPYLWHYLAEILTTLYIEDDLKYIEFETTFVEKLPEQRNGPFLLAVKNLLNKHAESEKPTLSETLP